MIRCWILRAKISMFVTTKAAKFGIAAPTAVGTANKRTKRGNGGSKSTYRSQEPPYGLNTVMDVRAVSPRTAGIEQQMTIYVPPEDPVKITRIAAAQQERI